MDSIPHEEWRRIYKTDPLRALIILTFEDLKIEGLKDNITISCIEGPLPTRLTEIPDWLTGDAKVLRDKVVKVLHLSHDEEWAYCVIVESGIILYVYHFEGTGDYDCCQSLRIHYSKSWDLLAPHILPYHSITTVPKNIKI